MKFTRDHVRQAYNEIDRRVEHTIRHENLTEPEEIHDLIVTMLQGLYAVFCAIADNWPEVRMWTEEEERKREYFCEEGK
jgi:hypothetical protein